MDLSPFKMDVDDLINEFAEVVYRGVSKFCLFIYPQNGVFDSFLFNHCADCKVRCRMD